MISVVTPSFNQGHFIREALESVRLQGYENYEHLVIDGASTDGTVGLLRDLATASGQVSWVSETDAGQSEALNKGFRRAKGEIIGWLNSDDRYLPGSFERIVTAFQENPQIDIIYGDYLMMDELGKPLQIRREIEFNAFVLLYHRVLYIPTTSTFFRRKIFEEGNWLDEELHYAMDLEFFIRLAARGYRFRHLPKLIAEFRLQPNSKSCTSPESHRMEHQQVVFATAPLLRHIDSPRARNVAMTILRSIACARRYSEKAFRGYYWEQLRAKTSSIIGM